LHPPSTATTVTVRDGKVAFTNGPFVEGAEVANGFCVLSASDRDEAIKIVSMIPATSVELRQLAGISGLQLPLNDQPGRRLSKRIGSGGGRVGPLVR
jgi:hypothetical protein